VIRKIGVSNDLPRALIAAITLAIVLSACTTTLDAPPVAQAISRVDAPPKEPDSMLAECPWEIQYHIVIHGDAELAKSRAEIESRLDSLGLRARWSHENASAIADSADDRIRLASLANILLPALERYPPILFETMGVKDIVIVKDLIVSQQRRRAMPDPQHDALIYADNNDKLCPAGMEMRVHHELYHFVDFRLHGEFYFRDPAWLALNTDAIEYGRGGTTAYGIGFQNIGHPRAGLVSRYAGFGLEEDKAEVFGWMMTPGYAARLREWAAKDATLAAKRAFMAALFAEKTAGRMNKQFFDGIANAR